MSKGDRLWWRVGLGSGSAPIVLGMSYNWTRQELKEELSVKVAASLEQGSKEWLSWRKAGVGASESAAILGINPWADRDKVKRGKLGGDEDDDNANTRRGKRLEPKARKMYEALMGKKMTPICAVHDTHDFVRASLDGITEDGQLILEIKCPTPRWHEYSLHEGIPDWYFCQVQHQMLVTGAPKAHYVSYCPSFKSCPWKLLPIEADLPFQRALERELTIFWAEVVQARA